MNDTVVNFKKSHRFVLQYFEPSQIIEQVEISAFDGLLGLMLLLKWLQVVIFV